MKEYKVVETSLEGEKEMFGTYVTVIDCVGTEIELNQYAAEGWRLVSVLAPSNSKFGVTVLFLEREKK
jgi:hypothetical protein